MNFFKFSGIITLNSVFLLIFKYSSTEIFNFSQTNSSLFSKDISPKKPLSKQLSIEIKEL
jgi:hypothetical protein